TNSLPAARWRSTTSALVTPMRLEMKAPVVQVVPGIFRVRGRWGPGGADEQPGQNRAHEGERHHHPHGAGQRVRERVLGDVLDPGVHARRETIRHVARPLRAREETVEIMA